MEKPKVIVLILSYNGKHLLEDSVSSYLANEYSNYKVVVIDNGSTDGTKEWVEINYPEVTVLRTDVNLKYSGGFNFGLEYAFKNQKTDYVLITNNDVKADVKVVSELVKVAESQRNIGFVVGKVYYYEKPNTFQTVGKSYDQKMWRGKHIGNREIDNGQYDQISERYWCDDIFWLVKKELYDKTGGYDTEFEFQAEDFDWQVRAKKAGFKIMYTPYAKIWHKDSVTIGKSSPFKAYYDARNPLIVNLKYRPPEQAKWYFRNKIKNLVKITLKVFINGQYIQVYCTWKGFLSAMNWALKNGKLSYKLFI